MVGFRKKIRNVIDPQEIFSYFTLVSTSFLKGNR